MSSLKDYYIDEEQWKKDFSQMLNKMLRQNDISINKVTDAIDVDPKTLRNYIDKKSVPSAIILKKLADFFNVSTDYMITNGECTIGYSDKTILELGEIIRDFEVFMDMDKENCDSVTLRINDRRLAMAIKEMYFSKGRDDYNSIVGELSRAYGSMKTFRKHLEDYPTYHELIRQEYIYQDIDNFHVYQDENGSDCYGFDEIDCDAIERRSEEWENMSVLERDKWWKSCSDTPKSQNS